MASLYELTEQALALQELLENGDIDDEIFADTLESLAIDSKIESICKVIKNLSAEAEALKAEKKRFEARQKAAENGVKRLKDSLLLYMDTVNDKSIKAGLFKVSRRNTQKVVIEDESLLGEYMIPQPAVVDVAGIKECLKAGEKIPGASLVDSPYIIIG